MSAWQDIFTLESWEILTGTRTVKNAKEEDVYIHAEMPNGKGAEECHALILNIGELINQYHHIPKADVTFFDARVEMLEKIGELTSQYIAARGDDLQHKKGRKLNSVTNNQTTLFAPKQILMSSQSQKSHSGAVRNARRTAHHVEDSKSCIIPDGVKRQNSAQLREYESVGLGHMDQWIISLNNRVEKKSAHLAKLKSLSEAKIDRESFIQMIAEPHQNGKLYPGVLIEKIDSYHRQCEFDPDDINKDNYSSSTPMNKAYNEWVKSNSSTPFFIWLESHAITTLHRVIDAKHEKVNVVDYDLKDALIVEIKHNDSSNESLLMARKITPMENQENNEFPLNTATLISGEYAECKKRYFSPAATAYVWDAIDTNKFITHPHQAGKYHHSSLASGEDVSCSGMWVVEEGLVKYIDNASGHYRNNPYTLYKLVSFLHKNGLINDETEVCEITQKGSIMMCGNSMDLQTYFKWARKNIPQVKASENMKSNDENFDLRSQCTMKF